MVVVYLCLINYDGEGWYLYYCDDVLFLLYVFWVIISFGIFLYFVMCGMNWFGWC